jgi:N-methylhydantoinase A
MGNAGDDSSSGAGRYRIAVDVGGTFIDYALFDEETGELLIEKQPATPQDLVKEFLAGLDRLPVAIGSLDQLFHGTTIGLNALLQERGAKVGLLTTQGFRDVLQLGRGSRPEIYNVFYHPPEPLVSRYLRREVPERLAPDGTEVVPLDLETLDREVEFLLQQRVEAIAICFLHSYANPAHESAAAERIRLHHPQIAVSASCEVATEWREFERTSTAVLNAYLQPLVARYLAELGSQLRRAGYRRPFALMQSNGGVISAARAAQLPIRTLESGPAGGVIGAQALARELGYQNVICADVGGTSYDVALIEEGEILERTQTEVAGRPFLGAVIDIVSIGAAGGSIAWIDTTGAVQVGPQSAGAYPGPVCFGHGGTDPTVTDCHLVLGRLDPGRFLGSRMKLDVEAAKQAIFERIAKPTHVGLDEAADGILAIAEINMTYAIRAITVERGRDPREFVLFSYGGGGGLFAAAVAEELEIPTIVVPPTPANFSAWGILACDYREDAAATGVRALDGTSAREAIGILRRLEMETSEELRRYGFDESSIMLQGRVDVRYAGQEHTITVPLDPRWVSDEKTLLEGVSDCFVNLHRQLYGHGVLDSPLEMVTCRCSAIGKVKRPKWPQSKLGRASGPRILRPVYFRAASGYLETASFDRDRIQLGQQIVGPAVVEEWTTTILVPPGWSATADGFGNLVLSR